MGFFSNLREKIKGTDEYEGMSTDDDDEEEGYVELDTDLEEGARSKVVVKPFVIQDFEDLKPILDSLRGGNTISLVNIKPLKEKDMIELKRAINKLKKTADAVDGQIAGFGEDYLVITPAFAVIHRTHQTQEVKES